MENKKTVRIISKLNKEIKVEEGTNLLETLNRKAVFLRTDCGGRGRCGKCLVKKVVSGGQFEEILACRESVGEDISIEIPATSIASSFVMTKAPLRFPADFRKGASKVSGRDSLAVAVDLGTTTVAIYLCDVESREVIASTAIKNPQAAYGDDVISRISAIAGKSELLEVLQSLVVGAIGWGIESLLAGVGCRGKRISDLVVVGNPTMIHILVGEDPQSLGKVPYLPAFYEGRQLSPGDIGLDIHCGLVQTFPQVSGFIGSDILAAGLAVDLPSQPDGTLLIDLGTNGELMLKSGDGLLAASCATGPAFEGAELSCGVQAIPGAINGGEIDGEGRVVNLTLVNPDEKKGLVPVGICGPGVLSFIARMCEREILLPSGAFAKGERQFDLTEKEALKSSESIYISQKDIRAVQLGKAALITGIEMLLERAGFERPAKILIAGAFGTHVDPLDMIRLGMIPAAEIIEAVGNGAGSGAVMALCGEEYRMELSRMAEKIETIDLAHSLAFRNAFIENLSFPSKEAVTVD